MKQPALLSCPSCQTTLLKRDKRYKQPLRPQNGAHLTLAKGQVPRVRCPKCSKVLILLRGSTT